MSFPGLFTLNIKLKLLSLLFASVLGLFVFMKATDEMEIPVLINFINIPHGFVLKEPVCRQLTLSVAGPRLLLMKHRSRRVSISLDLSGLSGGKARFSSLERYVAPMVGVASLRASPAIIEPVLISTGKPSR